MTGTHTWEELTIPIVYDVDVNIYQNAYGQKTTTFIVQADGKIYTVKYDPSAGKMEKIADAESSDQIVLPAKIR